MKLSEISGIEIGGGHWGFFKLAAEYSHWPHFFPIWAVHLANLNTQTEGMYITTDKENVLQTM